MKLIDKDYEKYIRFYLDSILIGKSDKKNLPTYPNNPNKKLLSYITKSSGEENYLLTYPLSGVWNLTNACNLRCKHCLYNDTKYSPDSDLSPEMAMKLTDELINDFGVTYMMLTGGEIFMRPDTINIIRRFKENNVALRLLTNAVLLRNNIIDELAELFNPWTDSLQISLDGATAKTHNEIRQADIFDKVISNIKKLVEKNIRVTIVCTINNINYGEVVDVFNLAKELGVYCFTVGKMVNYNDSHTELMIPDKDLFRIYYELKQNETPDIVLLPSLFHEIELLNIPEVRAIIEEKKYQDLINDNYTEVKTRSCHSDDKIAIQADGRIYLCLKALAYDIAPLGNYKDTPLFEIWENRKNNILFHQRTIEGMVCNKCKYNAFCNSGCMVEAYVNLKDLNSPQIPCNAYL